MDRSLPSAVIGKRFQRQRTGRRSGNVYTVSGQDGRETSVYIVSGQDGWETFTTSAERTIGKRLQRQRTGRF